MPRYSIPRSIYKSPFDVKKLEDLPNIGPGRYDSKLIRSSSGVKISPSKSTKSLISDKAVKNLTGVGPGAYETNISTFPRVRQLSVETFGTASRNTKISESIEI